MINRALTLTVVAVQLAIAAPLASQSPRGSFTVVEASIDDMRKALEQRRTTSREIVQQYLTRIAIYEDQLNAIITVNGRALAIADSMDRERARGRIRGPLHGIPIALKDNIHTTTMRTTGGALAFADVVPPYEATLARNLEAAGGPGEPIRCHPDHGRSGHTRSDGTHGLRCRHHAWRDGGNEARSARLGDDEVPAPRWQRLHEVPRPEWSPGCADRRSARVLL